MRLFQFIKINLSGRIAWSDQTRTRSMN